jgi:hypothetical protein
MSGINEFIFDYLFFPLLFILIVSMSGFLYVEHQKKGALYQECITTNYDKFQCYSMIYGDK